MNLNQKQFILGSSVAQGVISVYNASVKVDGKWGDFTQNAYNRLNPAQRAEVAQAVAALVPGSEPADYARFRVNQKMSGARMSLTKTAPGANAIVDLIRSRAASEGVPFETAYKFAKIESNLNPAAMNPSGATGLFQIMPGALADVNRIYGKKNGKQFTMQDMRDAEMNATVGVQYIKLAARYIGSPLDDVAGVYMAYNIGAGNVIKLKNGQFNDPAVVKAVAAQMFGKDTRTYIANVRAHVNGVAVA